MGIIDGKQCILTMATGEKIVTAEPLSVLGEQIYPFQKIQINLCVYTFVKITHDRNLNNCSQLGEITRKLFDHFL